MKYKPGGVVILGSH